MADQVTGQVDDVEEILRVVHAWPRDLQMRLARSILEHLSEDRQDPGMTTIDPQTGRPYITSGELRGIGAGGRPAPSDEQVEHWRLERYGE